MDLISGSIILLLSIMIFPAVTSGLYALRKGSKIIVNFLRFYTTQWKNNYQISVLYILALLVVMVDAFFFKKIELSFVSNLFFGLGLLVILLGLNSALLASTFSMSLKNLVLLNLAYFKDLSLSSLALILILMIPFRLDPLIYLLFMGLAMFGQNYVYKSKLEIIRKNITNPQIKYL